jgi:hypothetical protein
MAVNPWGQQSDENIEGIMAKAAKQVKKAASDTVKAVVADAKQQVTGDPTSPAEQASLGAGKLDPGQQSQIQQQHQQVLAQTRQNLEQINAAINKARQERLKRDQEVNKKEEQKKEQKKQVEEQKKQEDPAWKRLLKGKMGSRESHQRAGG